MAYIKHIGNQEEICGRRNDINIPDKKIKLIQYVFCFCPNIHSVQIEVKNPSLNEGGVKIESTNVSI